MWRTSSISTVIALTVVSRSSADAAEPQKGPAFYTDVHGAGALFQSMHAVVEFDNSLLSYRDSGVNWLLRRVRESPGEGRTWLGLSCSTAVSKYGGNTADATSIG